MISNKTFPRSNWITQKVNELVDIIDIDTKRKYIHEEKTKNVVICTYINEEYIRVIEDLLSRKIDDKSNLIRVHLTNKDVRNGIWDRLKKEIYIQNISDFKPGTKYSLVERGNVLSVSGLQGVFEKNLHESDKSLSALKKIDYITLVWIQEKYVNRLAIDFPNLWQMNPIIFRFQTQQETIRLPLIVMIYD